MMLRRVIDHAKAQNWTAVVIDFIIVVMGVFIGIQLGNWNAARAERERREQVTQALLTDLRDSREVQRKVIIEPIAEGLAEWRAAFDQGEKPPPYFLRIPGSDTAPDTWNTLQQEQLSALFDPLTLFDLGFYYSETNGVGRKYLRYIAFVESDILPALKQDPAVFYSDDGSALKPQYAASMDRLREYGEESEKLRKWADCLIYRIETARTFDKLCNRNDFVLEGMAQSDRSRGANE